MTNSDSSDQWSNEADYTFDVGILSPTRPPVGLPSAVFSNTWLTNSEVCPATGRPEERIKGTLRHRNGEGTSGGGVALVLTPVPDEYSAPATAAQEVIPPTRLELVVLRSEGSNQD